MWLFLNTKLDVIHLQVTFGPQFVTPDLDEEKLCKMSNKLTLRFLEDKAKTER